MGQKFYGDLVLRPLPDGVHTETTCFATMMILGVLGAAVGNSSASASLFRGPRTIRAGPAKGLDALKSAMWTGSAAACR